jgi:hypothetical protein
MLTLRLTAGVRPGAHELVKIMSEKRITANRKNAHKSTGLRTPIGKAASSRNKMRHGVLSTTPILEGIENPEAWEKHREGLLRSIAPASYLEELLTIRLAVISWRLWRVVRYEAEVAAAAVATAEQDLEERTETGSGKPSDPAEARTKAETVSRVIKMLMALGDMQDGKRLDTDVAVATLWALWKELPEGVPEISVPGIPS